MIRVVCGLWRRSGDLSKYSREALHSSAGGILLCCQSTSLKLPQIVIYFISRERGGRRRLGPPSSALENRRSEFTVKSEISPEKISKGGVHKKWSVLGPADDEAQLGVDD